MVRGFAALLALLASVTVALPQSGPPAQKTGPITIFGNGSTGDGSLFTAKPPGATVGRYIRDRAYDGGRNVRDFLLPGEVACNGTTDNSGAFQRAFDSGARVVRYDLEGCASNWLVNTAINVPGGAYLDGPGDGRSFSLGLRTTAAVDTLKMAGDQWGVSNVRIQHDGTSGMLVNAGLRSYGTISRSALIGNSTGNTSPLVSINGNLVTTYENTFTNFRTNAFTYVINSVSGGSAPIVHRFNNNNLGGSGKGMFIGADSIDATNQYPRPEGVYATNNHCFLTNLCLQIQSVNDFRSVGNTYDIGGNFQVVLAASKQGIDMASFTDDYFSTITPGGGSNPTNVNASCINASGPITRLTVKGGKFAYCGYGISDTDGQSSKWVISSNFLNIANIALNLQGVRGLTVSGTTCTSCAFNFILNDWAADNSQGGPYIINDNQWDPNGQIGLTQHATGQFRFGYGNSGIVLAGYAAATTGTMGVGSTCVALGIPHTLAGTPNLDKTTLTARPVSGAMTNVSAVLNSADAGSFSVTVCGNVTTAGAVRVTANSSL